MLSFLTCRTEEAAKEPVTSPLSETEVKSLSGAFAVYSLFFRLVFSHWVEIKARQALSNDGSDTDDDQLPRVSDSDESSDDITKLMSAATTAAEVCLELRTFFRRLTLSHSTFLSAEFVSSNT